MKNLFQNLSLALLSLNFVILRVQYLVWGSQCMIMVVVIERILRECFPTNQSLCLAISSIKYNNIVMCNCIEKVIKVICFQSPVLAMNQVKKIPSFHFILLLFILRLFCLLQIASYFPKFAWHHYLNTNQPNICQRKETSDKHF